MATKTTPRADSQYARMAKVIAYLAANWESHPSLEQTAHVAGLSPWHFQKVFRRWVGVSPKQFLGALRLDHARAHLAAGAPVLEAALAAGLSGPSRLHDLAITIDAVTPGEMRTGGRGVSLYTGTAATLFGAIFIATSARGITRLTFTAGRSTKAALQAEQRAWPHACFKTDDGMARDIARQLFAPKATNMETRLQLAPEGTNFQIKVWQALLAIPPGAVASYQSIAKAIDHPGAARAVGTACAANPIAMLIPCHRVLRESGALGGYAFGVDRKRALIAWENARADDHALSA
jgi:AraC family transcriptional regulator of adaptative response/methylated-DNA-[protein]-cysteine methyltransferase